MKIKLLPHFILVTFLVLLLLNATAQVSTRYTFASSNGTYTPITGGSVVAAATDVTTSATTSLDVGTYPLTLPFTFNFNGTNYTSCTVGVNGFITFGTTAPGTTTTPISTATTYEGVISAMSKDLWGCYNSKGSFSTGSNTITGVTDFTGIYNGAVLRSVTVGTGIPTGTTVTAFDAVAGTITMSANATATSANVSILWPIGEVRAEAIGTAPNRTFVIQFKGMADYITTVSAGGNLNFQIQLEEANGVAAQQLVRVVYGPSNNMLTTARTNQVGLRGTSNTDFNNRLSATDWTATTAGTANNSTVTRTNLIFPASGLTYKWSQDVCINPPTPGTTIANAALICSGNSVNFNLTGNSQGNGQSYQWQRSDAASGTYTNVGSVLTLAPFSIPNITHDSFYRCKVTCSGVSDYSTPVQVRVNPGLAGGTYTINSALPTAGANFNSFTEAINAMSCSGGITGPVVFNVDPASGPYTEQIIIPQVAGASVTNRITINGNGTTLQFAPVTAARHIVKLDGADYVTIKNLNITELASAYGYGIHLINGANFDSIVNCKIDVSANTATTAAQWAGIVASNSTTAITTAGNNANNLVVIGCKIIGGNIGIALNGSSATDRNYYNRIINDTIINFYATGVYLAFQDSTIVSKNEINRTTMTIGTGVFEGIEVTSASKNCIISFNRIHDSHTASSGSNSSYPIMINGADAPVDSVNYIYNNLIYNINNSTDVLYGMYNLGSDGAYFLHNTVVIDFAGATTGNTRGFWQSGAATNIILRNNNIYVSRGGSGTKYCIHFNTVTSSIISDNNNLYAGTTTGAVVNIGGHNGIDYATLAAWKTANSGAFDQLSKSVNPVFSNTAIADFTPTSSFLNDMSPQIPFITIDINGLSRGSYTEPGAFEFIPGPCSTPIAGDAITTAVLPPCAGGIFTLDLSGASVNTGQTYQWESSATSGGTFTPVGSLQSVPILQSSTNTPLFYRCVVTCPTTSQISTSTEVSITLTSVLTAGTYTIDATLPATNTNFTSIASAVSALSCGVQGSIIFEIANGIYNERVDIIGVMPNGNDSVVFRSASGDTSMIHIRWPASGTAGNNSIVNIKNSKNIVFRNLSFERTGTGIYATIFELDTTFGIKFFGNNMVLPVSALNTANSSHIYSGVERTETGTIISGNTFTGGTNGMWFYSNPNMPAQGTVIENNIIKAAYTGVFLKHHDGVKINNNKIPRLGAAAIDFYAISIEGCDSAVSINNNYILSGRGWGIKLTGCSGTNAYRNKVYNNSVSLDQGAGTSDAYGLQVESVAAYKTTNTDIYHNTVSVKSASGTTGRVINFIGSATNQNNSIIITNNILVNRGSGYVYYVPVNSLSGSCKFDRNNVHTTGVNIGTWNGTTGMPFTQQGWISTSGMDSLSSFVKINIVDSSDLHLAGASIGDFNLATDLVTVSTIDFDGNPRSGSYHYKGAYEATQLTLPAQADAGVWAIDTPATITPTGNNNLVIVLRNNGFVPLTSADIGYKVGVTQGTAFSWTGNLLPGATAKVTIAIINLVAGTDVVAAWTENTNMTFTDLNLVNDTAKKTFIASDPLHGTYTVGAGQTYANLTAVATALRNASSITNNLIFELAQSYTSSTETFPVIFTTDKNINAYSITVRPAAGVTGLVTEGLPASTAHLIVLDSATRIIFDGRPDGGTTSEWTIRNKQTATTYGACIRFVNGAQYDTLRYLKIEGQGVTATMGHITFSTTTGLKGNSYNTVEYCTLRDRSDVSAAAPSVGIYSAGTATTRNEFNTISHNTLFNFAGSSISLSATGNGNGWKINDNHIYFTSTATAAQVGINILSGAGANGYTISDNFIGGTAVNCGGTPWVNSGSSNFSGIVLNIDSMSYSLIDHNTIANISKTATGAASFAGISLQRGRARITNNTIGRLASTDGVACSGSSYVFGIEVQNDAGIADTTVITGNTVSYLTSTGTAVAARVKGISINFTTDIAAIVKINNNTVHHLSTTGTSAGYAMDLVTALGIYVFPSGYRFNSEISNNTVYSIEAANTGAVSTICAGIGASNYGGILNNNRVWDIRNKSTANTGFTTAISAGVYTRLVSNYRAYNNMISLSSSGNSDSAQLNGILIAGSTVGGTHNITHNSVHLENGGGNHIKSFVFHRGQNDNTFTSAQPIVLRNNIFNNALISIGNHYAIGIEDTAIVATGISNYNDYKTNDPSMVGLFGTRSYNISDWQTRTSNDANTKNIAVNFLDPGTADLHLTLTSVGDLNLAGIYVSAVAKDFDGETRYIYPYMGADENTAFPLPVTLVQFTATQSQNDVMLNWATATETNSSHFIVERSVNGKTFEAVAKVKASGKSNSVMNYRSFDENAFRVTASNTLYYRLKMVDNDGKYEYSKTAIVSIKDKKETAPLSVFPNPYSDKTYLQVNATEAANANIAVVDITGKVVISYSEIVAEGSSVLSLQQSETLKAGIYFVSIEVNRIKQVTKLVKQ
jgi:hypothetical protein